MDEVYLGGKRKNMPKAKRVALAGRGAVGKTIVAGAKDRETNRITARPVDNTDKATLQGFVADHAAPDATIYTDEASGYKGMPFDHETVNHSAGEYVRGAAHTNGIEAHWSMIKRGYHGTFHHFSEKHTDRYLAEFTARHNMRDADTIEQMGIVVSGAVGKRLKYQDLIA